ncbi:MAG: hypothetical protein AB7Y46_15935 [Armatimonadota bacterium]
MRRYGGIYVMDDVPAREEERGLLDDLDGLDVYGGGFRCRLCPNCGEEIWHSSRMFDDALFCFACGERVI